MNESNGLYEDLAARLDDLAADVAEHDSALMNIIRRDARGGASVISDAAEISLEKQLELVDRAGAVYDRLAAGEKRLFEAILKSSLERRRHLSRLMILPDEERDAVAFVLSLDEHARGKLAGDSERSEP